MIGLLSGLLRRPADVEIAAADTPAEYGRGYADGKAKAHFEMRVGYWRGHAHLCGCEPCQTVRAITAAVASTARRTS